jgi:hypothetical protein
VPLIRALALSLVLAGVCGAVARDDLEPDSPAAFLPGGLLGVQLGGPWEASKQSRALTDLKCQAIEPRADDADEVCFFRTAAATQVAGAPIHDGFLVRKGDHVALIGTGIAIKNADDPLAESVVRSLEGQVHAGYQHTGDDVLFVRLPRRRLSAQELTGYSRRAPVLLVQLEHKSNELAVLYGYLAPVNLFGSLSAE